MSKDTSLLEHIVLKAKKADPEAQSEIYRRFSKAMFNICIRMSGNKEDAEDLLHEVFVIVFTSIAQLKNPERLAGWIRSITINQCIAFCRKKTVVSSLCIDEPDYENEEWFMEFTIEQIHEAIKRLPNGSREIFNLYAVEGLSHKTIAAKLQITESTSKSQYHRARSLLKDFLTKRIQHG